MVLSAIWSLELRDASETAVRAAVAVLNEHGVDADAIDPNQWLTWHLDTSSVKSLEVGLRMGLTAEDLDARASAALQNLLEDCQRWLGERRV